MIVIGSVIAATVVNFDEMIKILLILRFNSQRVGV